MKFPITFGAQPIFCVTFLRSYVNMGGVQLTLATSKCHAHELQGMWARRSSQLDVSCFAAYTNRTPDRNYDWPRWQCGFDQKPRTSTQISLKHIGKPGEQFK